VSIKAQYVTLRVEFDTEFSTKPSDWNWDGMMEENVEVIFAGNVFDPKEDKE